LNSAVANPPLTPGAENREFGSWGSDSQLTPVGFAPHVAIRSVRGDRYATFNVLAPEPVQRKEVASRPMLDAMHTGESQNLWRQLSPFDHPMFGERKRPD